MTLAFPKPKDDKRVPRPAYRTEPDGREICGTHGKHRCIQGAAEYKRRILMMLLRQNHICCLSDHCPTCPGFLSLEDATFEHENGRGKGNRDDRLTRPEWTGERWFNGAAHLTCNYWKGSRRINYNGDPRNP